jgi:energy-coupling factor transporter ATP-binding protein EcfA2
MTTNIPARQAATIEAHAAVAQALEIAVGAGVPVVLTGPPGCGKSAAVKALAHKSERLLTTIIASLREPSDFAGCPIVEGRETYMAPPAWARTMAKQKAPILFLDEVSTAPQSVQAALLRVVDEGVVGELPLPGDTSIVAAMNPPDSAAGGWDLAAAFSNRWLHLEWTGWSAKQWNAWARTQNWGKAGDMVGAFLLAKNSLLHAMPADAAQRGKPWPSHRTWARGCTVLHCAHERGIALDDPVSVSLVSGCVGNTAALQLAEYIRELDLPDPEKILRDPESWKIPGRSDRVWATLSSVCRHVMDANSAKDWERAWTLMAMANASGHGDLAISASGDMARNKPRGAKTPKALVEFLPLLKAAGLLEGAS